MSLSTPSLPAQAPPVAVSERWTCRNCGFNGLPGDFYYGRGRHMGEHPEHDYCPACHCSITWFGYRVYQTEAAHGC